jgi:hypothetical protein
LVDSTFFFWKAEFLLALFIFMRFHYLWKKNFVKI